jgi:uncharacterized protein (DUF169 family)
MDLQKINEMLNRLIRPQTYPLSIKICKSESELPPKAKRPVRDLGYKVALCQALGLARRFRWAIAVGDEDQCCIGGAVTMGYSPQLSSEFLPGQENKQLEKSTCSHVLVAPVEITDFEPDMILLYCDPAQANRLAVGAIMGTRKEVPATAPGFQDCGDAIAKTIIADRCHFILASGGDRNFGGTQDNEVIFTIPISQLDAVLSGLEGSHKMGFRYPILTDLRHRPQLAEFLERNANAT